MDKKELRATLEQQLQAVALEKQKTLDSLQLVAEPKKRKRVYELLQLQSQQQDELHRELNQWQRKEQKVAVSPGKPHPKLRIAVGIGFAMVMLLLGITLFQYNSSLFLTGLSVGELPSMQVQDKHGTEVGSNKVELREDGKYLVEINIPEENSGTALETASEASIAEASEVEVLEITVLLKEAELLQDTLYAKADYYTGTPPAGGELHTKVISVEGVGKVKATIHLPKLGEVNTIFRCDDFDQDTFECGEWEAMDIPFTADGNKIIFTADTFSTFAAGEIKAIDAVHLDANYNFISNVFEQIKAVDEVWSEPISVGEFVRATFERNLTDGRIIDIFVRSETMDAYVEVYEAGTDNLVGSSTLILSPGWKYITVGGLTQPSDVFDLKITSTDPQAKVEFDYIHDDIISGTQADGLVVYGGLNNASFRTRLWNESGNFTGFDPSGGQERTQALGVNGSADARHLVLKGLWKYDQMILGTIDTANDVNVQIYNNSNTGAKWDLLTEVSISVTGTGRPLDIAVEELSGDALMVFENSTSNDLFIQLLTWNGSRYSVGGPYNNVTLEVPNQRFGFTSARNLMLFPQPKSDNIMMLMRNLTVTAGDFGGLFAINWDGNTFDKNTAGLITNQSGLSSSRHNFAYAWESNSGEGIAVYGINDSVGAATSAPRVGLRTYSPTAFWGNEVHVSGLTGADGVVGLRLCADPNSDFIGLMWMDQVPASSSALNVSIWNGSELLNWQSPLQDASVEISGSTAINFDCAWFNETSALFGFIDSNALNLDYFTYTRNTTAGGAWNETDLTITASTYNFASDDIENLHFSKNPATNEIMVLAMDALEDLTLIRWLGNESRHFRSIPESPVETSTEVLNGATDGARFDWFRYDPGPNVTTLVPASGSVFTVNDLIDVGGNVTDTLFLPSGIQSVNITYPNGSNFTYTASNTTGAGTKFNFTFTDDVVGSFTVRFLGNDSRNSLNYTETTTFTLNAAAAGGGLLPLLISADIINLSSGTSSQGGGFVISSTTNSFTNGTSLSAATVGTTGLSVVNLSSGVININLSLLRNATHGNYPNVTFAWVLGKSNGSTMLNTTIQNNTFNQSAFNYSFNANLLPDGIYNISVFVENISEGATRIVNYSRGFDIAIDRTPPNVTLFFMNTSNATSYRLGTTTEININATLNDSTTSVPIVIFGIFSVGNGTEFNVTPTKQGSYWFVNLALGPLRSGDHIIRLYGNDTLGNFNNSVSNLSFTLNSAAPASPLTGMPANGSAITNRTPIFDWFNSSDVDGDVISYHIQIDDNARFNNPEINVSAIQDLSTAAPGNTTWYSTLELAVDTRFYWRVRANDSNGYGNWSNGAVDDGPGDAQNLSNFTVSSLLSITMTNSGVEFGTVSPGTEANTSDGDPLPFRAENTGNIDANVSVNGSTLYSTIPINRSAYQFRIRANESDAFSTALSATGWTNMTNSTTAAHVVNLTWRNAKNDFLTDLNLTIPSDEPSGFKTANITFTLTRNE